MNIRLKQLQAITRQTIERITFSPTVTFLYGPVGTGKSTVARLVDYCFGGNLERTPAIQQEFVSVQLDTVFGQYICKIERAAGDTQAVRVSWSGGDIPDGSVNAPLLAGETPIIGDNIYNLSDLLFFLSDATPIKVRKSSRDPESPMIRLSFRDIWWYCYLEQTNLDSSFFRLEDPFRGRKSQDAMRFFTGLHSERLSQLETDLYKTIDEQQGKREAVRQIRQFMTRFKLGTEIDVASQIERTQAELSTAVGRRQELESARTATLHPTDPLRERLRKMGSSIAELQLAIQSTQDAIAEQRALRAELITTKVKADRTEQAHRLLDGVEYSKCPQCGTNLSARSSTFHTCRLCTSALGQTSTNSSLEVEALRRELNDRIDQIADSIQRREQALSRSRRQLERLTTEKKDLDDTLQRELSRYDSAFVESVRAADREIATLDERLKSFARLQEMPRAIAELEEQAGSLQGAIDRVRSEIDAERSRLRQADLNISVIAKRFKAIMISVGFPGVVEDDKVVIDPRNWRPLIVHANQDWSFWDAGSGGKKTLFNVCYALAVHEAARELKLPVPNLLVIDSPTKNISGDENPELVKALYREIYRLAALPGDEATQFLLIDSDLVEPEHALQDFRERHLAGVSNAPSLIPYYSGP